MTKDNLDIAAGNGARAQALLDNPLLADAFTALEESYLAAWRSTTIDDVSGREKLFIAVNIVGKVRDHLMKVAANGKLAAAELRQITRSAERRA